MNTWFRLELGDASMAWEELERNTQRFQAACRDAGEPRDMTLFMRHESEGRLHCQVVLYFSPGAAPLAKSLRASPCPPPPGDGLSLLAGSAAAQLDSDGH